MIQMIYNAQTKVTTMVDVPDIVEPHAPIENEPYTPKPTTEEVLNEVIAVLIDKGVLY